MSGWVEATLSDVCHVYQPQTLAQKQLRPGPYRVYGANGQIGWHDEFNHECGQLLLGCRGSVGFVHVTGERAWINGNAMVVIPTEGVIERDFLAYALRGGVDLSAAITGAAQPQITRASLGPIPIAFPSNLTDQRRIVAILDEAFEAIATAKANADKNLQNARDLFNSHLEAVFSDGGADWVEKRLGDVCELENGDRGKNYPNRSEYVESGIPWINTGHIRSDGTLSMEEMNFITRDKFDSLRSGKIRAGDLVYCLRGATLGKTALVDPLTEGGVASSLVIVRPAPVLRSRFLYFFLTSPRGQRLIDGFENGAAQPNLGARSVAKYPISIPAVTEQEKIVEELTELRDESQRLARIYERKLAALDALKRSFLHQAFSGAL